MFKAVFNIFLFTISFNSLLLSQTGIGQFEGKIDGYVYDRNSKAPLEYANIVIFYRSDSSQVNGTVTNPEGYFSLEVNRPGNFYVRIGFIGYKDSYINEVVINRDKPNMTFDEILLEPQTYNLNEVVVQGEGAPITYHIDKKVINVSQQLTSLSGNAVDVLENVPSVQVDIEGNVTLRGSGSFQVLIDGRPTILDASDALQQIPASAIENIEIITNPSAKYNPEGTAGIINVILKKNTFAGLSGILEVNAGSNDKYGGETLLDYKIDGIQINLGLDYNQRSFEMNSTSNSRSDLPGYSTFLNSSGSGSQGRTSYGFRGSININMDNGNSLTLGGRYGDREHKMNGTSFYTRSLSNTTDIQNYFNSSSRSRGGSFYEFNLGYQHKFDNSGHELTSDIQYEYSNGDELNLTTLTENGVITYGQRSTEDGPDNEFRIKLDYVLPFTEESKFEAGYQTELDLSKEFNNVYEYDISLNDFVFQDLFSNETKYDDIVHSLYSLYSGGISKIKYQFGLRGEQTIRKIELLNRGDSFKIDEFDFFPTFHMSSKLADNHQVMASYTRRIQRPRGWELEPFYTWIDAYNIRIGNPSLKPEYIDSYELAYQLLLGKSVFSVESYYRINHNLIERIRSIYNPDVNLISTENVGKSSALGIETMMNFDPVTDWNVNLMGDFYNYKIEGNYFDQDFSKKSFSWSVRLNNMIKFTQSTQLQFNTMYNSPVVSAQDERKGFFSTSLAVRQDLFDKQLSLTLQFRDLFRTAKWESTTTSSDLYRFSSFKPESPMVMLNARFNFNNYKKQQSGDNQNDMGGMNDDF